MKASLNLLLLLVHSDRLYTSKARHLSPYILNITISVACKTKPIIARVASIA